MGLDSQSLPATHPNPSPDRGCPVSWYLRSMDDRDTHRGELQADGTVLARCGVRFAPLRTALGGVALPGHPYDRDQICLQCYPAKAAR